MMKNTKRIRIFLAMTSITLLISACGGGGGDDNTAIQKFFDDGNGIVIQKISSGTTTDDSTIKSSLQPIQGAAVKGPLVNAYVTLYQLNTELSLLYDPNFPLSEGTTNNNAEIENLFAPSDVSPPYVLVVTGDNAIDLNTGTTPVLTNLVNILTVEMIASQEPVYATPLTTITYQVLRQNKQLTASNIESSLKNAANTVVKSVGFDLVDDIDILRDSPIATKTLFTDVEAEQLVRHRTAIELLAAMAYDLKQATANSTTQRSSDEMLELLSKDINSDNLLDGQENGKPITNIDSKVMAKDPSTFNIPNTLIKIVDVSSLLANELKTPTAKIALINATKKPKFSRKTIKENTVEKPTNNVDNKNTPRKNPAPTKKTKKNKEIVVIVDNDDSNTSFTGTWKVSSGSNPYGATSVTSKKDSYTWNGSLPTSGVYEVYIRWTYHKTRSTYAPYTITHADGSDTIYIDQKKNGGKWNHIGNFSFISGKGIVTLQAPDSNVSYSADAIKFVYKGINVIASNPNLQLSINKKSTSAGENITLNWSSTNTNQCNAANSWTGLKGTSGTETISNILSDMTFILTCHGPDGLTSKSITVALNSSPLVTPKTNTSNIDKSKAKNTTLNKKNSHNLIWWDDYESYTSGVKLQKATTTPGVYSKNSGNGVFTDRSRARNGKQSIRAYVSRDTSYIPFRSETMPYGGINADVRKGLKLNEDLWYGFSIYIPEDFVSDYTRGETIAQWHGNVDNKGNPVLGMPQVTLRLTAGNWQLGILGGKNNIKQKWFHVGSLPAIVRGQWHDIVFHFVWAKDNKGLVEMWLNGTQYINHSGVNVQPHEAKASFFKYGIYKTSWRSNIDMGDADIRNREFWFDELRIARGRGDLRRTVDPAAYSTNKGTGTNPPVSKKEPIQKEVKRKTVQRKIASPRAVQQRKGKAAQRKAAQRKAAQRKAAQRKAAQRKAVQRKAVQRKAIQRKAAQRKAAQRKAAQRKAAQRKAAQRKTAQRKTAA